MKFLPIVVRELRASARKRATYRTRMAFVLSTSAFAALLLLAGDFASATRVGGSIFWILTGFAFAYCLAAGPRYAADALSEEKREGTIGLLFLTDLRGYDVVLGKLMSVSTRTVQGLIAFVPVLSVALLLGGVTGGEFWRTSAALFNGLFVSLSFGLVISAVSRQPHRAMAGTVLTLGLLILVPLGLDAIARFLPPQMNLVGLPSPLTALRVGADLTYRADPGRFWLALAAAHLAGWVCLLLASIALPYAWQQRPAGRLHSLPVNQPLASNHAALRAKRRTRLLDLNPVCWLASRQEGQRWLLWGFVAVLLASGAASFTIGLLVGRSFGIDSLLAFLLALVLKFWVAWQACSTLAEARRNGAVELLLATPLRVDEIIRGHWQALQRFFLWPVIGALCLNVLPAIQALLQQKQTTPALFFFPIPGIMLFGMATLILDLLAIAWVGMWMGLSQPKAIQAFGRTVLYAIVLPMIVFCLPNVVLDLFWISWARRKLEHQFRNAAAQQYIPEPIDAPPLSRRVAAPPVITHV